MKCVFVPILLTSFAAGCAHDYVVRVVQDAKPMPGAVVSYCEVPAPEGVSDSGWGLADGLGCFRFSSRADCVRLEAVAGANLWGRATLWHDSGTAAMSLSLHENAAENARFRRANYLTPAEDPMRTNPSLRGSQAPRPYTVKDGEDLYAVAIRWGVSPSELKATNHLTSSDLKAGQILQIPAKASSDASAPPF